MKKTQNFFFFLLFKFKFLQKSIQFPHSTTNSPLLILLIRDLGG